MARVAALAALACLCAVQGKRYLVQPHTGAGQVGRRGASASRGRRVLSTAAAFLASVGISGAQDDAGATTGISAFDRDGNGKVELGELLAMVRERATPDIEEEQVAGALAFYERLVPAADMDGDGGLDEREMEYFGFLSRYAMSPEGAATRESDEFGQEFAAAALAEHDSNGDGTLDAGEYLAAMVATAGDWGSPSFAEDPDIKRWLKTNFEKADVDGDGVLNVKEGHFVSLLSDADFAAGVFGDKMLASMMFDALDKDGDRRIDEREVATALEMIHAEHELRAAGSGEEEPGKADGEGADAPGAEASSGQPTLISAIADHFAEADADGDGNLDVAEATVLARRILSDEL
mmetsp:Transcript_52422/g.147102  ORF Transcript_52422/g.147102 Transcript_52422/m.147102 type:complete len:350 (+) Transcript_52422:32-1081(+)